MNQDLGQLPEASLEIAYFPVVSVVVPTFNERANVARLRQKLEAALVGIAWEIIFVDDNSPDGTWEVVRDLSRRDPRVRCIRRLSRRGLAGACIEGILACSARYVAVMDADLQHDEKQLRMPSPLQSGQAELVVGSRYPMSGFFMIRRDRFEHIAPEISTQGFKILLDIVATAQGSMKTVASPYTSGARLHGVSKLDSMVALEFPSLVLAKFTHDAVSLRFLLLAMVGGTGLFVHLGVLFVALHLFRLPLGEAQTAGAVVTVTSNFTLNNFPTYRDQRVKGLDLLRGLAASSLVCNVGLHANVGVALSVYVQEPIWWLADAAGALIGVVWNYAVSGAVRLAQATRPIRLHVSLISSAGPGR